MSVIRAFIAIDLTDDIRSGLDQVSNKLRQRLDDIPVRWVPVKNIHLTLKFLGEVSLANLEILKKILQSEAANHRLLEVSIGGLGAYPNLRRPRVIWIGVEAPPELAALQRGIEIEMARIGYARENRPFSPHLTLGRVSRTASPQDTRRIGEALEALKVGFLGLVCIREIQLYRSDLKPNGAIYTCLFSTPLNS